MNWHNMVKYTDEFRMYREVFPDDATYTCHCNICGYRHCGFLEHNGRKDALCPICFNLERHRHLFVFLVGLLPFLKNRRVLHFAPEELLRKLFTSGQADYFDADLDPEKATHQVDITDIPFEDDFFDYIVAIHVLEHIEDDRKAMSEIFRVLKPGGTAFLAVPFAENGQTLEGAVSPAERIKLYGQDDHVRMYAFPDFCGRLKESGFLLKISRPAAFPEQFRVSLGLGDNIVLASKARHVK